MDIVIVNYRTGPLVLACLESLAAEREDVPGLHVVLVDNASRDGSADFLDAAVQARGWDWVTLIRSEVNGGFGAGANIGFDFVLQRNSPARTVWLLNPDTRVMPGASRTLLRFLAEMPSAGIAGTALLEADGNPWPFAFRFPTILGEMERGFRWGVISKLLASRATLRPMGERNERVDWVSGASFAIRRDLLEQGMRFDEGYFLYYEETDFCRAAWKNGWESWYVPQAVVLHIAGQSTGVTAKNARLNRMPGYWFASRQRYFRKNHGRGYAIIADLVWVAAHLAFVMKQMVRKSQASDPPGLLLDFMRHSAFVPRWR
ncbi:glycosyltransferase family 2 protein [Altericroceibacterium xinjiangense]|uniref:glycosyltransferase family 2 protein n=1 Tax=Altericroceibacterium xinjiangense TaxID=762261 RepID=UPI001F49DB3E|nr:glycosyltransferase family 2 protein [Altericroceibacterium xinjiangense]